MAVAKVTAAAPGVAPAAVGASAPPGDIYQELLKRGLTPEQIDLIISSGVLNEEGSVLDEQRAMSQALRETGLPEGRDTGATYVAANPLEFAGALANQYVGKGQLEEQDARQLELAQQQADRRAMLLRGLTGASPTEPAVTPSPLGGATGQGPLDPFAKYGAPT